MRQRAANRDAAPVTEHLTASPKVCPRCPWRATLTPTAEQVAAIEAAAEGGLPVACTSGQQPYAGTICAPWLAADGRTHPAVVAALAARALDLGAVRRRQSWPPVHGTAAEVFAASEQPATVDPIMVALREAREAAGMTQAELARIVGVRVSVLRDHEKGRTMPDLGRLRRYADALGMDLAVTER